MYSPLCTLQGGQTGPVQDPAGADKAGGIQVHPGEGPFTVSFTVGEY